MEHIVPLVTEFRVQLHKFLVGGKALDIGHYEVQICLRAVGLGRYVAAGEEPELVKYLGLEAAENVLNGLGRAVVRLGGAAEFGDLLEPLRSIRPLGAALVIEDQLFRQAAGEFDGVAIGLIHALEILHVGNVVAQEHFGRGVHHLEHLEGCRHPLAALEGLVIEIELGTVTIPEGIPYSRQDGGVLAGIEHLGRLITQLGILPLDLNLRAVQESNQGIHALEGFPPLGHGHLVELFKQLLVGIDRGLAPLEGDDLPPGLRGNLHGIAVGQLPAHQAAITLRSIGAHLFAEPGRIFGERVAVHGPQIFAGGIDGVPVERSPVPGHIPAGALEIAQFNEPVQGRGIDDILINFVRLDVGAVGKLIILKELTGLHVHLEVIHISVQHFFRISILGHKLFLESRGKGSILYQGMMVKSLALAKDGDSPPAT